MKKILSLLSTISLSIIITTNIIACNKANTNNENNKPNKPIEPQFTPQQPPTNSNGKLVKNNNRKNEFLKPNDKGYFYIRIIDEYICEKVYFDNNFIKNHNTYGQHLKYGINFPVYRGDGVHEPIIPTINKNTGEITDGNEKI